MRNAAIFMVMVLGLVWPGMALAQDWGAVIQEWEKDPGKYRQQADDWQALKKKYAHNEKAFKKSLDQAFSQSFEAVFKKKVTPSDAYDLIKLMEQATAGEFKPAADAAGEMLIAKYLPVVGNYAALIKETAKVIKAAEQVWVNELYQTQAFLNASAIIARATHTELTPYVPSFWIKFDPAEKTNQPLVALKKKMTDWEAAMFREWKSKDMAHEAAVTQLVTPPWAARIRSAIHKDPTERQLFNHFLYRIVSPARQQYMETLKIYYLEDIAARVAKDGKTWLQFAVAKGVSTLAKEMVSPVDNLQLKVRPCGKDLTDGYAEGFCLAYSFLGEPNRSYTVNLVQGYDNKRIHEKTLRLTTNQKGLAEDRSQRLPGRTKLGQYIIAVVVKDGVNPPVIQNTGITFKAHPDQKKDQVMPLIREIHQAAAADYKSGKQRFDALKGPYEETVATLNKMKADIEPRLKQYNAAFERGKAGDDEAKKTFDRTWGAGTQASKRLVADMDRYKALRKEAQAMADQPALKAASSTMAKASYVVSTLEKHVPRGDLYKALDSIKKSPWVRERGYQQKILDALALLGSSD